MFVHNGIVGNLLLNCAQKGKRFNEGAHAHGSKFKLKKGGSGGSGKFKLKKGGNK